jgi:hypothetical protein
MDALYEPTRMARDLPLRLIPLCEAYRAALLVKHIIRNAPTGLSPNNI